MCGIAGFSGPGTRSILTSMMDTLSLRGPDDCGEFYDSDQNVYLGHRRLSIVDISGGHQPMSHKNGKLHVIFNGEIYNQNELRRELVDRGHVFITDHSDTEVLLHGYKEWGSNLPKHLNGMFAFTIFDATNQILFMARDRFGEKPLYYSTTQDGIIFGSELKAIIQHPACTRTISKASMKKFFAYGFVPAPNTIISSIRKLMPGQQLTYDLKNNSYKLDIYWSLKLKEDSTQTKNESELAIELKHLVQQAVERRLMSDVPLGVFLSGGVDSSIVLSAVTKYREPSSINTFSIGFKEESFDESIYARKVASFFGVQHHERILGSNDARNILDYVLSRIDEPIGDPSILPTYLLSKFAREEVKVALGGDGADELFSGYDPFKAIKPAEIYSKVTPIFLHNFIYNAINKITPSDKNMSFEFRLKRMLRGLSYNKMLWNPVWLGPLDPAGIRNLFGEEPDIESIYSDAISDWQNSPYLNLTEHTLSFYTNLYLSNNILTKVDRASMLVSLESRAPFLDNDLVSFVEKIPTTLKFNGNTTKYLLKQAFKNEIPEFVIKRTKKGFGVPLSAWLREWDDPSFIDNLPYIDKNWLMSKWNDHKNQKDDHRQLIWCAISLSRFIQSINTKQN